MSVADPGSSRSPQASLIHDYSLEITGRDTAALVDAAPIIPAGTRVNVTYLGNEEADSRIEAARAVVQHGFLPIPHIAARRVRSQDELQEFLARLQESNASSRVFIIGGDPATPEGPFDSALTVIESGQLARHGVSEVGIAGYPEGHPDVPREALWDHLTRKIDSLENQGLNATVVTQFGFDTEPVVAWVREVRDRGYSVPLRIGIPGPAGVKRLLAYARRFGIGANAMIVKKYGFSLTNLLGTAGPDSFVDALTHELAREELVNGVALHMYAFGGLRPTVEWAGNYARRTGVTL